MILYTVAACDPVAQVPKTACVYNDDAARIIDANGDIPGSQKALRRMHDLYRSAGFPLSHHDAFDRYATAHGDVLAGPPTLFEAEDFPSGVETVRIHLMTAPTFASPDRLGRLERIRRARIRHGMDDPDAFVDGDEVGVAEDWLPHRADRFYRAAGIQPKRFTDEEVAAKSAYLQQWLAGRGEPTVIVVQEG